MSNDNTPAWWIYQGTGIPHHAIAEKLPEAPPPWRDFSKREQRGTQFKPNTSEEIELVNTALYLRRPLLVTGKPGTGKTSLAYAVAHELQLGKVLRWSITTRSTLQDGLYRYDAVARLQETALQKDTVNLDVNRGRRRSLRQSTPPDISRFLRLGPLGTAFAATDKPRVLLIDEIDKSDIDLPNDLLHLFEEGEFEIPELARLSERQHTVAIRPFDKGDSVPINQGQVLCSQFPLVIMTSNGEREFPPAFLRRCLRLDMQLPNKDRLKQIVQAHLGLEEDKFSDLIEEFMKRRDDHKEDLATDQLLNAAYFVLKSINPLDREALRKALWKPLSNEGSL
jgi:MoxR-like ATPase